MYYVYVPSNCVYDTRNSRLGDMYYTQGHM